MISDNTLDFAHATDPVRLCPICKEGFAPTRQRVFCSNKCRQKSFSDKFKIRTGLSYKRVPRQPKPKSPIKRKKIVYRPGARTRLDVSVMTVRLRGQPYVRVNICVGMLRKQKYFSIRKLGLEGAKMAASLLRLSWLIELSVWSPRDGDPFEIMSYAQSMKGNHEYENSVVDGVSSPWIQERQEP